MPLRKKGGFLLLDSLHVKGGESAGRQHPIPEHASSPFRWKPAGFRDLAE